MSAVTGTPDQLEVTSAPPSASDEAEQSAPSIDLPGILRKAGGIAVALSLVTFLFKGWTGTEDLMKFALLLGSTVGITTIALLIVTYLKESKGPRLLLSLSLVAVPINFSILGAFILYATTDTAATKYPDYLAWTIGGPVEATAVTLVALACLIPVIWLGFRTLSRGLSGRLTFSFLASNLALLIPTRDPMFVTIAAVALGIIAVAISAHNVREKIESQTREGKLALILQFIPLGIILGRTLWIYHESDELVLLAAAGLAFLLFRQIALIASKSTMFAGFMNFISLWTAVFIFPLSLEVILNLGISESLALLLATTLTAALPYEISQRSQRQKTLYRSIAMFTLCVGSGFVIYDFNSAMSAALVMMIGGALIAFGLKLQERALTITGTLLLLFAGIDVSTHLFAYFDLGLWLTLMLAGISAIIAASVLDTHGRKLRSKVSDEHRKFSEWEF